MNLTEIIAAFVKVEEDIEVEGAKLRVYPYLPPGGNKAIDTPCIMHQYRRTAGLRIVGSRMDDFIIRVQLLVAKVGADTPAQSALAAAFDGPLVAAFDANVMLGSTSAFQRITDEQAEFNPGIIDWNGIGYVGVQYDYRVSAHVNATLAP